MDPKRWQQIEQLYHAALEREPSRRAAFLTEACRSDNQLRLEVESLLARSNSSSGALRDRPGWHAAANLLTDITVTEPARRRCLAFHQARYWRSVIAS
jgi:hypothetical protein